jgi:hypothetical protein
LEHLKERRLLPWKESRLWKPVTFAKAQRTAAAANARLPANLPARPLAALQIRSAKTLIGKHKKKAPPGFGGAFFRFVILSSIQSGGFYGSSI